MENPQHNGSPQNGARVTPERIMQMAWGYAPALILEAAVKHHLFDAVDGGAKTLEQIAEETGASQRGLRAVLNALVGFGFLAKENSEYSLTPESETFLVSTKPAYIGGFLRHTSSQLLPPWMQLTEVVQTGKPVNSVNLEGEGTQFFQQFVEDLYPTGYAPACVLAQALGIPQVQSRIRVLDLAAGSGVWSIALAQQSPQVQVTAVDWSGIIPVTRRTVEKHGLSERYSYIEGDLQEADFGSDYNVATLGHILHSEGEARSRALLQKTFEALAPGGTIAIAEFLVNDDRNGPPMGLVFAVNMLVNTEQGDAFSFEEISSWLHEAGFENVRTLDAPGPSPLILADKPAS
jgi:SAM-dependent methyltransferase